MNRLTLTHLTLTGAEVEAATVSFGRKTNVVRGPSDTGKSFIVDAIDFMLGASTLKEIPERAGYSTVLLGLALPSGEVVTLSRSVNGGSIGLHDGDIRTDPLVQPPQTLGAKHSATSDGNLSRYLLSQIGLDGKRVRRNARNETDSLSFRNVAHLCVVDETQMQSETPPALSGMPTDKTKEISTLKLFLQGEDDSNLVQVESKAERNRATNAKSEVIDQLLADLEKRVDATGGVEELRARAARLEAAVTQETSAITDLTASRSSLAGQLAGIDGRVTAARRRVGEVESLDSRFRLLLDKYASDLQRLEMIAEAGTLLGFFNPGTCVFCGAEPEHQHFHAHSAEDATHFGESVVAEQRKTAALKSDLTEALSDLARQQVALSKNLDQLAVSSNSVRAELRALDQTLAPHKGGLAKLLKGRSTVERHLSAYGQINKLRRMKAELAAEGQTETAAAVAGLHLGALANFSKAISERLQIWGVPDADRVRYDRKEQDLIAGDQLRSAHGKGVRAMLHAAFTIGLAQYCFDLELPHPGFVVLDSPLVTYRPPSPGEQEDPDDIMDASVAARFYTDIQASFDGQILIMENMDPPDGLEVDSVDMPFTKSLTNGRYGFFPYRDLAGQTPG